MPAIRVIIVNFNAGDALAACVEAVLAYPGEVTVTVADNDSKDDSMATLSSRYENDPRLVIEHNGENIGFGRAVNKVARAAGEDFLLVLNPDCLLETDALQKMVGALEADPRAAIAGPWVTDPDGKVQSGTWRRLPDPWLSFKSLSGLHRLSDRAPSMAGVNQPGNEPPGGVTRAEAVSGACMLWRRSAVQQVGYLDENYTMHAEDLDLMRRLADAGFYCVLVPDARAVHSGGLSSASRPFWVHRQKHVGMQRYFSKFLAPDHSIFFRAFVHAGIWGHYLLTLPRILFRRITGAT